MSVAKKLRKPDFLPTSDYWHRHMKTAIESPQSIAKFRKCKEIEDISQPAEFRFLGRAHKAKTL